jgi:CubicO group peptidase (beta-lactamase class C family)
MSDTPVPDSSKLVQKIDQWLRRCLSSWPIPGLAVGVVKNGDIVFKKTYGRRHVDLPGEITPSTKFHFGSCGKSATALLCARFVSEGRLEWDSPLREVIPEFRVSDSYVSDNISFRDLLSHRHGLGRSSLLDWAILSEEATLSRTPGLGHDFPFRDQFYYSNLGYTLVGYALARLSGVCYSDLIRDKLLRPLGIHAHSSSEVKREGDVAAAHMLKGKKIVQEDPPVLPIGAAGPIWIDIDNATKYLRALASGTETLAGAGINPAEAAELVKPQSIIRELNSGSVAAYSLGLYCRSYLGERVLHHSGACFGYEANLFFIPEKRSGIVVLLNSSSEARDAIGWYVLDLLLDAAPRDWIPEMLERERAMKGTLEEDLKRFCESRIKAAPPVEGFSGTYWNPLSGAAEIRLKRGRPYLRLVDFSKDSFLMVDEGDGVYSVPDLAVPFVRSRPDTGTKAYFTCRDGRLRLHLFGLTPFTKTDERVL